MRFAGLTGGVGRGEEDFLAVGGGREDVGVLFFGAEVEKTSPGETFSGADMRRGD